jgi:hypothetical protein
MIVAYAVGAALVIAAELAGVASTATLAQVAIVATVVSLVGMVVLLSRRAALERALAEIRAGQTVEASEQLETAPSDVADLIGELRKLGFELAGATDTLIGNRPPIRTWVMTENAGRGTTWVEVGSSRSKVAIILSRGRDGRFLETVFPDGATIDHPNVFTRPIATSVADAVQAHREVLAEWTSRTGPALEIRTLRDYRHVEPELRERTGGLLISAHLARVVQPGLRRWTICTAIGLVTLVGLAFLAIVRP